MGELLNFFAVGVSLWFTVFMSHRIWAFFKSLFS